MEDIRERVTRLEVYLSDLRDDYDKLLSTQDEILLDQQKILDQMTRYKGFIGGVAFLGSCIGVGMTFFKEWLWKHLT